MVGAKPIISFTSNKTTITVGDSILFINTSVYLKDGGFTYWFFKGGTPALHIVWNDGTTDSVYIRYDSVGIFDVRIAIDEAGGNADTTFIDYIEVIDNSQQDTTSENQDTTSGNEATLINYFEVINSDFKILRLNNNLFTIEINLVNQTEKFKFEIHNINGQNIYQKILNINTYKSSFNIDLSNETRGLYFAGITGNNDAVFKKFLVE